MDTNKLEIWLRGEYNEGIIPELQPVANAILQAKKEINEELKDFPSELLHSKPAGCASIAFHLKHIVGFHDRLLTYAQGNALSDEQLGYLQKEELADSNLCTQDLLTNLNNGLANSLERLKNINKNTILEPRFVGRKQLPTTQIGLLIHIAEHTMRHVGQILVTAKILRNQ